jgi:hypothetical protein
MVKLSPSSAWAIHQRGSVFRLPVQPGQHLMPFKDKMRPGPGYKGKHFLRDAYREVTATITDQVQAKLALLMQAFKRPGGEMIAIGKGKTRGRMYGRKTVGRAFKRMTKRTGGVIGKIAWRTPFSRRKFGGPLAGEQRVYLAMQVESNLPDMAAYEAALQEMILGTLVDASEQIRLKAIRYAHQRGKGTKSWGAHDTTPVEAAIEATGPTPQGQYNYFMTVWISSRKWRAQEFGLLGSRMKSL